MNWNKKQTLLLVGAIGLIPIALSYGFSPSSSLPYLFDFNIESINSTHIFRAVMGLYFSHIVLWFAGAFFKKLTQSALVALSIFMFGLASGRALSFILDGVPNQLLIFYFSLEILMGVTALLLLMDKKYET